MTRPGFLGLVGIALILACGNDESGNDLYGDDGTSGSDGGGPDSDGDGTGSSGDGSGGADDGGSDTDDSGTDQVKYDVDNGGDGGDCGCGLDPAFSYIWISNSGESTVSKVDTMTMQEVGRYLTREDGNGNPSRTSVSFSGDVAVANRHGGLTKFFAQQEDCVDRNGNGTIETSGGAGDVLAWDEEECRAWYTAFPVTNQRPVAWQQGQLNSQKCRYDEEKVWTVASTTPGLGPGIGGIGGVTAFLVNGVSGVVEQSVDIPDFNGFQLGAYGGAVDGDGNLWFSPMGGLSLGMGVLARVEADASGYELFPIPANLAPYGITVDHNGRVWVSSTLGAGAGRFDYATTTWETVDAAYLSTGGLMEDALGNIWVSTGMPTGAVAIDSETMAVGDQFVTGDSAEIKGISVDVEGYIWVVSSSTAYKVDPTTLTADTYTGLSSPYTYSDMTGWALHNATCPPAG